MSTAVELTVQAISAVVPTVPIGTNLALVHILWVMMSGAFLPGRGAFFTAFDAKGFDKQVVRRSWAALWCMDEQRTAGQLADLRGKRESLACATA